MSWLAILQRSTMPAILTNFAMKRLDRCAVQGNRAALPTGHGPAYAAAGLVVMA